jgi:hypothetical protein
VQQYAQAPRAMPPKRRAKAKPKSKQRGGRKQRKANDDEEAGNPLRHGRVFASGVVNFLLVNYAWGKLSPQMVQDIAQHVKDDFDQIMAHHKLNDTLKGLEALASIGAAGRHPQNCARDLHLSVKQQIKLVMPRLLNFPLQSASGKFHTFQKQRVFFPHEWFAEMYNKYPDAFRQTIVPSTEKLEEFWNAMEGNPQMDGHPLRARTGFQRRAVPIKLHGDGVPVTGIMKLIKIIYVNAF